MASLPSELPQQQQPPSPDTVVMFQPFSSSAQASFWQELAKLKRQRWEQKQWDHHHLS
eukprot:evm.model.NODE_4672_length_10586_cov_28.705555.1